MEVAYGGNQILVIEVGEEVEVVINEQEDERASVMVAADDVGVVADIDIEAYLDEDALDG